MYNMWLVCACKDGNGLVIEGQSGKRTGYRGDILLVDYFTALKAIF